MKDIGYISKIRCVTSVPTPILLHTKVIDDKNQVAWQELSFIKYSGMYNFTYMNNAMKKNLEKEKMNWDGLTDSLKSIAHSERLAILHLMCNCGCSQLIVKNIYNTLHLDQSTSSRHLGIMKKRGLLKREVKNGNTHYGLNAGSDVAICMEKILTD